MNRPTKEDSVKCLNALTVLRKATDLLDGINISDPMIIIPSLMMLAAEVASSEGMPDELLRHALCVALDYKKSIDTGKSPVGVRRPN